VDYPLLDTLTFYRLKADELEDSTRTGSHLSFNTRPIYDNLFIFRLPEGRSHVVISASAKLNLQLPLRIVSKKSLTEDVNQIDFLQAIYIGVVLLAIFGSFFIGLLAKSRVFLPISAI
jgi:hypothetical protein